MPKSALFLVGAIAALSATPALARGGWGHGGWGGGTSVGIGVAMGDSSAPRDARDGKVQVETFVADGPEAAQLGKGPIAVARGDGSNAVYEAAVIDALVKAGYNTQGSAGQRAEVTIDRSLLAHAEDKHNPVSGGMDVGISNHGTYTGMGIGIDLTKPRSALMGTRMSARIIDPAGKVLWEGRADFASREGDRKWTDEKIAAKLTKALFARFPDGGGATLAAR